MRYLSVCSGIEAATAAWHPLGWEPAAFSEIDPFPRAGSGSSRTTDKPFPFLSQIDQRQSKMQKPAKFEFVGPATVLPPEISDPTVETVTMGSEHYLGTRQQLIDLRAESDRLLARNAALEGMNALYKEQNDLLATRYDNLRNIVQRAANL